MSYVREQPPASTQTQQTQQVPPQINVNETTGAGPIATGATKSAFNFNMRRVRSGSRLEKIGFWIIVAAAMGLLVLMLGVFLPPLMSALFAALFTGMFAGMLTMMNLPRPSAWGNSLLGRKVFPVVQAPSADILRLARINSLMVFIFTFIFYLIASFVGPVIGGVLVFAGLVATGIFYARNRSVVIKP